LEYKNLLSNLTSRLRKLTWAALLPMVFLLFGTQSAEASHIVGGDVYYTCLGPNTYEITFALYRDCDGISMPTSLSVTANAPNCGTSLPNITFNQGLRFGDEITPVCPDELPNTTCTNSSGAIQGTEVYEYTAVVTLPSECDSWVFGWTTCCRNGNITNGVPNSMYIETHINNTNGICNNSAQFTALPTPYICVGQPFQFNHGAIDVDGDSLIYELISPMETGPTTFYTFQGGATPQQPFFTNPPGGLSFNVNTGQMNFTPSVAQTSVTAIRVYEIRNGDTIGITMRDIQVIALNNCTNTSVNNEDPIVFGGGLFDTTSRAFIVCQCDTLDFVISASDPDGDSLTLDPINSNIGTVFGSSNVTLFPFYPIPGQFDTLDLYVQIRTCNATIGVNNFTIAITDNACPLPLPAYLGFNVIIPGVNVTASDTAICAGIAQDIQLSSQTFSLGAGGIVPGSFQWQQISGTPVTFSDDTIPNPVVNIPGTTTPGTQIVLEVQYITTPDPVTGASCVTSDQVIIDLVDLPLGVVSLASDTSLCQNGDPNSISFTTSVSGPGVDLVNGSYTWTSDPPTRINDLSSTTINNPTASSSGGPGDSITYYVTYDFGVCSGTDTVGLKFRDGTVDILPALDTICPGDTIALSANYGPVAPGSTLGNCGLNAGPCATTPVQTQVGTPSGTTDMPFDGFWEDGKHQMIIRASELTAAGIQAGLINALALNVTSIASTQPYTNFTINIGCTALNEFTGTAFQTGLSQVFTGTYTPTVGLNNFVFTTPYEWDGVSNIIIQYCFDNNSWTNADFVESTTTAFNSTLEFTTDGVAGCAVVNASFAGTNRPVVYLSTCLLPAPLVYDWSPNFAIDDDSAQVVNVWPAGTTTYYATVFESGCPMVDSATVVINTTIPAPNVVCGSPINYPTEIQFDWSGSPGANGWEYSLDSGQTWVGAPLAQDSLLLTGFTNGDCYELQVRATGPSGACPDNAATIFECCTQPCFNPTQIATVDTIDLSCFGSNDGIIRFLGSQGDVGPNYTFSLYNINDSLIAGPVQVPDTVTFSGLDIGTYYAIGEDAFGCIAFSDTVTLTEPDTFVASLVGTTLTSCWNTADGSATINAVGGTGPYTYLWDANAANQTDTTATGLALGAYSMTATDANGCTDVVNNVNVFGPFAQAPVVSYDLFNSTGCPGNGSATVLSVQSLAGDPIPGNPGSLVYEWSTGATDVLAINNLVAGQYSLTITDTSGCTLIDTFNLIGTQTNIDGASVTNPACNLQNGAIDITVSGDTAYTFSWMDDSGNTYSSEDLTAIGIGTYMVTVTGAGGCQDSAQYTLVGGGLTVNVADREEQICEGTSDGFYDIEVTTYGGSAGAVTYAWSNGETTQDVSGLPAGTYSVTVTLDGGVCTTTLNNLIVVDQEPTVNINVIDCENIEAVVTGGWPDSSGVFDYSYNWSNGDTTQALANIAPGQYIVEVTDINGCSNSDTVTVVEPLLDAWVATVGTKDTSIASGITIPLSAGPGTPEAGVTYSWTPAGDLEDAFTDSTIVTATDTTANPYVFVVTADNGVCAVTDTVTLNLLPTQFMGFPTAFTPNADGVNDNFRPLPYPLSTNIEIVEFKVFNRWNNVVFDANDETDPTAARDGWDGTVGGNLQPRDAYIYIFSYREPGETEPITIRGEIMLLR
jgi:gliding motility-associated-like protein